MSPVSVVIVSNGRPEHLRNCLLSLQHQTHENFEVVVVSDALPDTFADDVRFLPFDVENIAAARNIGVANSAGGIVAFCDDDAVPDPCWLERLVAPFEDPEVGATGGYTRGRNGISLQWGAMRFDTSGEDHPFEVHDNSPTIFEADPVHPVKLVGTNMAFRKEALEEVGGFDEAFRFYLEDADIKLRLDQSNWKSAIIPLAQVHHGFAASNRRTKNRVPTTLFEIGSSKAYFCKKHFAGDTAGALCHFTEQQESRLRKLQKRHLLTAHQKESLLRDLSNGMKEGVKRTAVYMQKPQDASFLPFPTKPGPHVLLYARKYQRKWMEQTAQTLLAKGCTVTAILLTPSARYFQLRFGGGYWLCQGGVWGRSERHQPLVQTASYGRRFARETKRLETLMPFEIIASGKTGEYVPDSPCLTPLAGHNVEHLAAVEFDGENIY